MNKLFIFFLFVLFCSSSHAQYEKNPFPKTITVAGSAEMEIVPDEIYVQVDLKEYEKKGQGKISIDRIRQDFLNSVKTVGIPDSVISIAAYDGYNGNPWLRKKNKKDELMASITYQLKLKSSKQMDDLVNLLDDNATQNFSITRTSHSRLEQLKKELKIQAVKAAKEKARYLSEAIGEKIGEAVTINEPTEYYFPIQGYAMKANTVMQDQNVSGEPVQSVDFRKIKLKFDVNVVFSLL